jgi:hypothetical protein
MTTTILAPAAAVFTLTGLPADVFGACSLQPPAPAPAPPLEDTIYTPVAPGISYEALPEIVVVDTSPDQIVGCIFDTADNAQSRLNALFPDAIAGDGVIERRNNDIWVFDGTMWNNVGPTPGPTIQNVTSIVLPYNETAIYDAQVRLGTVVSKFDYALELLTEVEPLVVTVGITAARVKLLTSEAGALSLSGQAAALVRRYRMVSAAGSFALNGFSAGSVRDYIIGTNAGTFTATGQAAALVYERLPLISEAGAFTLDGEDALFFKGANVGATTGSFTVTGQDAYFERNYVLGANAASFSLSGQAANLAYIQATAAMLFYSGNGGTLAVTGAGFEPGFVYVKRRDANSAHGWFDNLRGPEYYIRAGQSGAEVFSATSLTAFDADGFSLGADGTFNTSGATHYALALPKGSAASSNTNGTLATTVTANQDCEYSSFTYTGNGGGTKTIGHGLSGAPDLVIIKERDYSTTAYVGGPAIGANKYFPFNSAATTSSTSSYRAFNASTVEIGSLMNDDTVEYRCWAFKSKTGSSNISSFTGGGTATHSVTLGYTPKFVVLKNINATSDYFTIFYRPTGGTGYANFMVLAFGNSEGTSTTVQITSDGFSVDVGGPGNVSGGTTEALYWAMA